MRNFKRIVCICITLLYTYIANAQTVQITQPNGGEILFPCQYYDIKWTQSGTISNYWNIDYSIDGGTIWASITTNFLATNGSFTWTVPNVISNTVLIRVYDAQNPATTDQSDALFSITKPITVTWPNGGETLRGGTVRNITWATGGFVHSFYNIYYSLNNGSTWTTIKSSYTGTDGIYPWTVPVVAYSTTCLVRVQYLGQSCTQDISDAVFTIEPPAPLLTYPNGGETWQLLCANTITWRPDSMYTTARLDYSTDNGSTWNLIDNSTTNDGSFTWYPDLSIPPSTNCLIRISNTNNVNLADVSNSPFTIAVPVTVTSFNSPQTVVGCSTVPITWKKTTCAGTYWNLYYSADNGTSYNVITGVADNGSTTQTYNWLVPNGINSNTAKIKILASSYNTIVDESEGNFSIIPSNDITVTSANGGETWQGLTTKTITWTNLPTASGQYNVQYSLNNGSTWTTIATNITGNSYNWTLPNVSNTTCKIKVTDYVNNCKYDESDATFTITPAVPILTSPNATFVWQVKCSYNITWNTASIYASSVRLDYSVDGGSTWTIIVNGTSNDGTHTWEIPANITPSTNCLIRLSNYNDLSLTDISNNPFTIAVPVTVTSFNIPQTVVGCSTVPITWTKTTCTGTSWYIYYSTDNGASYSYIGYASDNGSANQTFNWVVPNGVSTTTAKIKIMSFSYNNIVDESEGNFSIIPSNDITVTSPNGGEIWQGLTTQTITWTNMPNASGQYNVEYSLNNGSSWTYIAINITGNSYNWTLPNVNNISTCKIKVTDYANNCKYDESDATFTIIPAVPILTSPNAAFVWQVKCSYNITWNTASMYASSVRLDYSLDGGTTWNIIVNGTSNDGTHAWDVPATVTPSTNCLIRLSNYNDLSLTDISNNPFTIAVPVTVTSFNNPETIVGCSTVPITWTKTTCTGTSWYIYYSTDNGASYSYISYATDNGSANQTFNWVVPNGINTTTAKIKILAFSYNNIVDESEGNFSIIPSNDITVTSPNGGESWQGLTTQTITWSNMPAASGQYNVQYSLNNGSTWTTIATNITGNSYNWTLPNVNNVSTCKIKVTDYINNCKYDESDASFTITPAVPVLTYPNGGQVWQVKCSYNITWNTASIYASSVRLDYSLDGGTTWNIIVNGTSNDGTHAWDVPATVTPSTNCLIRLSNYNDLSLTDISNNPFTIAAPVTITSFNSPQTVVGCSTVPITWTKTTCTGSSWYIYYSTDNGASYNYISYATDNGSANQTYNWVVPNGVNTTTAKIQIISSGFSNIVDESEGNFSIIPSNDITVTSANGGETWQGLSTKPITWTNLPTASGQYNVQYSLNNGSTWTTIATNITGNSYNWTLPNVNNITTCKIKVTDYINNCKYDESDATFTINPAVPVLTYPNGGQVLQALCTYNITWNTATLYTNVRLDYSADNGTTWTAITTNTSNDGSQSWTVPNIISSSYLVRISNVGNLSLADTSDATFSIDVPVTVTSFNSPQTVVGCSTVPITWKKTSCLGNWYIYYSTNNGATYSYITSVTDNGSLTQTYNWLVPNGVNTTTAKIQVVSVADFSIYDESEGNFSIVPTNDITVTSPNGGETWQGLSTKTISWTNLPTASGQYNLQYTLNNGLSWRTIATNITGNNYNWTLPNASSAECRIRVTDYLNTCKYDESNANFTITPAVPILTAPNGGEAWYAGTGVGITWNTASIYTSTVRLDYSTDNGASWITILDGTSNDGSEYWIVPNANSTNCLVRISNYGDLSVTDQSNAVFTIKPAVTIITPNGNNQVSVGGCTTTSITFDHSPAWTNYYIEYTLNDGATWIPLYNNFPVTTNPATFNWDVPNISSNQARVRVRPTANAYYDMSDEVFSIIKAVTLVQPNFGGIMQAGTSYDIQWSSNGISSLYDIFYSTNGGSTYTNIITGYNTSNNKYSWTVPDIPSTNCRIVIRDNLNTCKKDTSDMAFIISSTAAPITLVHPNGTADTLSACAPYNITWTETTAIGTYNIDYSLNSGATWINIVSNYSTNSNSYNWAIPSGLASNTVLLRISSAANAGIYDLSNAFFVITQPTYTFTGNGNWSDASNWANNQLPPANPPACTQIIIDNQANGECILNVPYTLPAGATLTVKQGKKLTIPGNLNIE